MLLKAREEKEGAEGDRASGGHGDGDVEKPPPAARLAPSSSKGRASSKEEVDSVHAGASVSQLSPNKLGEPGFAGCRGGAGGRQKEEEKGGGKEEEETEEKEKKEKRDSFDSAAGYLGREQ